VTPLHEAVFQDILGYIDAKAALNNRQQVSISNGLHCSGLLKKTTPPLYNSR